MFMSATDSLAYIFGYSDAYLSALFDFYNLASTLGQFVNDCISMILRGNAVNVKYQGLCALYAVWDDFLSILRLFL